MQTRSKTTVVGSSFMEGGEGSIMTLIPFSLLGLIEISALGVYS